MISFQTLQNKAAAVSKRRITSLFEDDSRAERYALAVDGLYFDYSKTNIDDETLADLIALLEEVDLAAARDAMFAGEKINTTENRAVLHTALRQLEGSLIVEGEDVLVEMHATLKAMGEFSAAVRSGTFKGQGGAITDVINIGIGGSDLGPAMAVRALSPFADGPRCHFVSNVDPADVAEVIAQCDPTTTLVIVASKTFTTIETMTNARTVRDWMAQDVADPAAQFAAISTDLEKTAAFGIAPERVFGFSNFIGGRYSMWGPIGLSLMMAVGEKHFRDMLRGAFAMDTHFRSAPWGQNLPALLALVGIWHNQGCGYGTRAVLPYDNRLGRLPAYLQQLEMESNGKGVTQEGEALPYESGPIVWGEPGTNGQHAFYQLIHQGTRVIPCEFLIGAKAHEPHLQHQQQLLIANCLAQSKALMEGRSLDVARAAMKAKGLEGAELERQAKHREFFGNRPSVTLAYPQLSPYVLGQVVVLYEHRVFVEGIVLGINSFDQWGVELGKELATALEQVVRGDVADAGDASSGALVAHLRAMGA